MPPNDLSDLDFSDPIFNLHQPASTRVSTSSTWTTVAPAAKPSRRVVWIRKSLARLAPRADWLISFIVHALLLITLAFIGIGTEMLPTGVLMISEQESEGPIVSTQVSSAAQDLEVDALSFESIAAQLDQSSSLDIVAPEAQLDTASLGAVSSAVAEQTLAGLPTHSMVAGRSGTAKLSLLSKYGGTAKTEAAVKLGLEWLIRQQSEEGWWSFHGPFSQGATFGQNSKAATGMALIAFLGAGHTHQAGEYRQQVQSALEWLVDQQKSDGSFIEATPFHHTIYTHAICTLAISEAYAMTGDTWLKPRVEKAVKYTLRAQGTKGGWRYEFRGDSDTSVTGWCMMALVSAKSAGIAVNESNLRHIQAYLNTVDYADHSLYGYRESSRATASMTAEGMLCRMYLGWPRSHPAIEACAAWLEENAPFVGDEFRYYYWYYGTQVMHHVGGDHWKKWNLAMREQLPAIQVQTGAEAGSWPPASSGSDSSAGRLYTTCMALYCLEVYYRHMPLYDRGE